MAQEFCVCDAWHASVPGDTWPNRLFSVAGREGPKVLTELSHLLPEHLKALESAPIYDVSAFTRHLDDAQWKWYSHDPATLRAIDGKYRDLKHAKRENFAFFDRKQVSVLTEAAEAAIVSHDSFLDDAAKGTLRDVSWIDPNFIDLSILDPNSNDDHPPSDIRAGQEFILEVYEALSRSPVWNDTMLVVLYDEHGGFYDHVVPPPINDDSGYQTLGVRVPAIVAGPRVKRFVCHEVFDHTTLIKTILNRFAPNPTTALTNMSQRVQHARDLSGVLQRRPRTDIASHLPARSAIDRWRAAASDKRRGAPNGTISPAPDGAGRPLILHDFQAEFARFAAAMREAGLPRDQP